MSSAQINKKPHQLPDGVSTCLTAVTDKHIAQKTHKDYAMNQNRKATQRDAEREDEAWEVQQTLNACRSTRIIKDLEASIEKTDELTSSLERSANRADIVVFCWVALILVVAVMWAFGQSPVRMCGGAM